MKRLSVLSHFLYLFPLLFQPEFVEAQKVVFTDVTEAAGITWVHDNGMSAKRYLPETMIGGAALLDYDNDGWLDIYLVTGSTSDFYKPENPVRNALYRNNGDGTFKEVTAEAGVPGRGFGAGVGVGDYDNDGWKDIFLTGVRSGLLYRNNGDGTFSDLTLKAGVAAKGWGASSAFFDYDNDGWLDLWVCGYVIWEPDLNFKCGGGETPRYCIPTLFDSWPSSLYRNKGDGTFEDVSARAGIADPRSKGLGVVTADLNNDGWPDVFQSNDTTENFLFKNRGDGTFEEIGLFAGVAFSHDGKTRSGMGVDAQDYDDDGMIDLFVANIDHEDVSIYRNRDGESFEDDVIDAPGLSRATRFMSTFGSRFVDFDNDGDQDIVVLNGHPDDQIDYHRGNITYLEKPLLFENRDGKFTNVSDESGPAFQKLFSGRGLATGDYDNDGDPDFLFLNNGQAPALVRNEGGNRNQWAGIRLIGKKSNRDGIGARISYKVDGKTRHHSVSGGSSYQSAHDHRILLGFGSQKEAGEIRIAWPSGTVDVVKGLRMGTYNDVTEGSQPGN
ncbi:MAG TPA: CRTAC1 family protein [Acidobacteriota bacterium]|nr:CRTAC1 family protein [Acidobacteriota bacterium]